MPPPLLAKRTLATVMTITFTQIKIAMPSARSYPPVGGQETAEAPLITSPSAVALCKHQDRTSGTVSQLRIIGHALERKRPSPSQTRLQSPRIARSETSKLTPIARPNAAL